MLAALIAAVVEEELQQRQVVVAQVPAQEEVAAQAAVEVLDEGTGPDGAVAQFVECLAQREVALSQDTTQRRVAVPAFGAVEGDGLHGEELAYVFGSDRQDSGQGREVAVELGGEGEQVVPLTSEVADEPAQELRGLRNAGRQFGADEVVQVEAVGVRRSGQSQDIVA